MAALDYYDVFLISKDGVAFYTAAKEADYQSNLLTGPYKDSNLGKLVREVMQTKQYGVADFAPYAPSDNEPAAFVAQPVLGRGGAPRMVVALQMSIDTINAMLHQRDGLGETGEVYLVGPDKLMRSDSFLDPTNRSVKASFANPEKGKADTTAVAEALAGKSGVEVGLDYDNEEVLAAYAPLKFGGITWAIIAQIEAEEAFAAVTAQRNLTLMIALAALAAVIGTSIFVSRMISRPVVETARVIGEIAKGDFTLRAPVRTDDEVGHLGHAVNGMVAGLRTMLASINENARTLATSSEELSAVSTQLAGSSEEMAAQATGVASATEQMSSNINSMASAVEEASVNAASVSSTSEQMSSNMNTISSAIEELSLTINEVARNSGETAKVANQAMEMSKSAGVTMKQLGEAASDIGKVTEMIKRIAEQTNLLALNATIEAASAGEAGKGFAVVANEIKELANQSAQAAEDIASKIAGIQGSTGEAVKVIADVSGIINQINSAVAVITNAVKEQTRAANEIASNVAEASSGANNIASSIAEVAKGASDISKNAGEAAKGAGNVSSNIHGISKVITDNNAGVQQIRGSSGELAKVAGALQEMVGRFKIETNGNGHRAGKAVHAG